MFKRTGDEKNIDTNQEINFYDNWFSNCQTLEFIAKNGDKKYFVEMEDGTDRLMNISDCLEYGNMAVKNAINKHIAQNSDEFFYKKDDEGVKKISIGRKTSKKNYYVKCKDITHDWPGHFFARTKIPLLGYKAVDSDYRPVTDDLYKDGLIYRPGNHYCVDESRMIHDHISCKPSDSLGYYFSISLEEAMSYLKPGGKIIVVAASGLLWVRHSWKCTAASSLFCLYELSSKDIANIQSRYVKDPQIYWDYNPHLWSGGSWSSADYDIYNRIRNFESN